MKSLIILLLFSSLLLAESIDERKTDIYFSNGMGAGSYEKSFRQGESEVLSYQIATPNTQKYIGKYDLAFNTGQGVIPEYFEAWLQFKDENLSQKLWWDAFKEFLGRVPIVGKGANIAVVLTEAVSYYYQKEDIKVQVKAYEKSIKLGHGVLVLAHAQGNFFTNKAYNSTGGITPWMRKYFITVGIASPSKIKIPHSNYLTYDNDPIHVLNGAGSIISNPKRYYYWVANSNVNIDTHTTVPCASVILPKETQPYCHNSNWNEVESDSIAFHAFSYYMKTPITSTKIYNSLTKAIEFHNSVFTPSQYKKEKQFGCDCKDKYITVAHKHDSSLDANVSSEEVLPFDIYAKLYMLDGQYVKAHVDGEIINIVDKDDVCKTLTDINKSTIFGEIAGKYYDFKSPSGIFSAKMKWNQTAVKMTLSNSLMQNHSSGCGVNAIGSGDLTLSSVYPGTYATHASAKGYEELDYNTSDTISLTINAVSATQSDSFNITNKYQYSNLGKSGHIADIIISRPKPNEAPTVDVIHRATSSGGGRYSNSGRSSTPHYRFNYRSYDGGNSSDFESSNPPMCEDESCACLPCEYSILLYLNQSKLGPISGAKVKLYKATQENDVDREFIYEGFTTSSSKIDEAGVIKIPVPYPQQTTYSVKEQALLDAIGEYDGDFILEVSGGFDIDRDDDLIVDSSFTQLNGKLRLILSKQRLLQNDYKVNILTEIAYQLSLDLLGEHYDKLRLQTRLDDIASRVLIEKLYPSDNQALGRDDLFYWLPMAHKDWLVKPYDATLKPIVNKIYTGEDIYDDAYNYVYKTLALELSTVPIVKSQWFNVDENTTINSLIGEILVSSEGKSSVSSYSLDGEGSEMFRIDSEAKVYLKETLDYETRTSYPLTIKVSNDEGESKPVTLYIIVNNIADVPEDVSFSGGIISEDAQSGTVAGNIVFDEAASPIQRIELSGADRDDFTVDIDGTIRVSDSAKFDYEKRLSASISLQAFNSLGGSKVVNITFAITDAVDIPIVQTLDTHLKEDALVGQEVGVVTILSHDPLLSVELSGSGKENFEIELDGTLRVSSSALLDYESRANYVLQVQATNIQGTSRMGVIIIRIDNVADVPELEKTTLRMIEGSDINTVIGKVKVLKEGVSPIREYRLFGNSVDKFSINNSGVISVLDDSISQTNQEYFNLFVIAINDEGESLKERVVIYIDTKRPILGYLDTYIYEDAVSGTSLGLVPLKSSPSPITSIRLEGIGAENFTIDINREVKVSDIANLDYERKTNYTLNVIATNSEGDSDSRSLHIRVIDRDDTIQIKGFSISISEPFLSNTIIGIVATVRLGGKTIKSYELRGEGHQNFTIDSSGIVSIADGAVFNSANEANYHLSLVALDSQGMRSNLVYLDVKVENKIDQLVRLTSFRGDVKEDAQAGVIIGRVDVASSGEGEISSFELTGEGHENFRVDVNGTISVSSSSNLDYENIKSYLLQVKATNAGGVSPEVSVRIYILNVAEHVPVIKGLNISIMANIDIGVKIAIVEELDGGDSPIISFSLDDNSTFSIDNTGIIRLKRALNHELENRYSLRVVSKNLVGLSADVTVNISVVKYFYNGTANDDIINATQENEQFRANGGNDVILGGLGDDNYIYYKGDGNDTIEDEGGDDKLYLHEISKENLSFTIKNGDLIVNISEDNSTITITQWGNNEFKIETIIFDNEEEIILDDFNIIKITPNKAIADLSKLYNVDAVQVVQGDIIAQDNSKSVDHWIFNFEGGNLIIDMLSELSDNGSNYVDIDRDGVKKGIDIHIYLFKRASKEEWNFIAQNDDSSSGKSDGSSHSYDSYLNLNLEEGEYLLAVGGYALSQVDALLGKQENQYLGAYQASFSKNLIFSMVPDNAMDNIYGGDHFNYYVLEDDIDAYNIDGLRIVNPIVLDANASQSNSLGRVQSNGRYLQYYPEENFIGLQTYKEVNIVYDVTNKNGISKKSLLTIKVIPSLYSTQEIEINSMIYDKIKTNDINELKIRQEYY